MEKCTKKADHIIVETEDDVLECDNDKAQDVKKIMDTLK